MVIPTQKCNEIKKKGTPRVCVCECMRDYHACVSYVFATWSVPWYEIRKWIKKFSEFNYTTHFEVLCEVTGHRCKRGHQFCPCRINSEFRGMPIGRKGHKSGETIATWIMTSTVSHLPCNAVVLVKKHSNYLPATAFSRSHYMRILAFSKTPRLGWLVIIFL